MPNVHEKSGLPLANKYRPRLLADVIGQDVVKRYIVNAIGSDKVHHAYLFSGPSGTGKTTVARIFASCVNASKGASVSPDLSKDDLARSIVDGGCVDVREARRCLKPIH